MSTEVNKNCSCKQNQLPINDCPTYAEPVKNCSFKCNSFPKNSCPSCPEPVDNDLINFSGLCDKNFSLTSTTNNWTELTVNGSVLVPEVKPSIEQVEEINAKIEIIRNKVIQTPKSYPYSNFEGKIVTGTKLIVEGLICLSVFYVSKKIDQTVHNFHGKIPFSGYIVLPVGTDPNKARFHVASCIEKIIVKQVCDGKVNLTTTFVLQAIPLSNTDGEICFEDCDMIPSEKPSCKCDSDYDLIPEINGLCTPDYLSDLSTGNYWTQMFIPEILNVPCYKPPIEQILSVTSKVEIFCQKVIQTPTRNGTVGYANNEGLTLTGKKLVIEGILRQRVVYVAKTESQSVHAVHFDVPISTFIVLATDDNLTDKFKVYPCIEDIFICNLNDKQIFKNTTLFIKAIKSDCDSTK